MAFPVVLTGGPPWGFKVEGGCDFNSPIKISSVGEGSKAQRHGLREGDIVDKINGDSAGNLTNYNARRIIRQAETTLILFLLREKKENFNNIPEILISSPTASDITTTQSSILQEPPAPQQPQENQQQLPQRQQQQQLQQQQQQQQQPASKDLKQESTTLAKQQLDGKSEKQQQNKAQQQQLPQRQQQQQQQQQQLSPVKSDVTTDSSDPEGTRSEEDLSGSTSDSQNSVVNLAATSASNATILSSAQKAQTPVSEKNLPNLNSQEVDGTFMKFLVRHPDSTVCHGNDIKSQSFEGTAAEAQKPSVNGSTTQSKQSTAIIPERVTNHKQDEKLTSEDWWNSFLENSSKEQRILELVSDTKVGRDEQLDGTQKNSVNEAESTRTRRRGDRSRVTVSGNHDDLLKEWRDGLYKEKKSSGRRSVDLYEQLSHAYQHSNSMDNHQPQQPIILKSDEATFQQPIMNEIKDKQQSMSDQSMKQQMNQSLKTEAKTTVIEGPIREEQVKNQPIREMHIKDQSTTIEEQIRTQPIRDYSEDLIIFENMQEMKKGNEEREQSVREKRRETKRQTNRYKNSYKEEEAPQPLWMNKDPENERYKKVYRSRHENNSNNQLYKLDATQELRKGDYSLLDDALSESSLTSHDTDKPAIRYRSRDKNYTSYRSLQFSDQPIGKENYEPVDYSPVTSRHHQAKSTRSSRPHTLYDEYSNEALYRQERENEDYVIKSDTERRPRQKGQSRGQRYGTMPVGRAARDSWDEENLLRKLEIERRMAERHQKLFMQDSHDSLYYPSDSIESVMLHQDSKQFSQPENRYKDEQSEKIEVKRKERRGGIEAQSRRGTETRAKGKAKALYSFKAQDNKELSFKKGDVIYLLRQIDNNWIKGELNGKRGIVPINYLQILVSIEEARAAATSRDSIHATAKNSYLAQSLTELSFEKGDLLKLTRKHGNNWYEGRCGNREGLIPASYVKIIRDDGLQGLTPLSSCAATPVSGSGRLSPASSIGSLPGPEVPSAPLSPWETDFYESDFGTVTSRGRTPLSFDPSRHTPVETARSTPRFVTNQTQLPVPQKSALRRTRPDREEKYRPESKLRSGSPESELDEIIRTLSDPVYLDHSDHYNAKTLPASFRRKVHGMLIKKRPPSVTLTDQVGPTEWGSFTMPRGRTQGIEMNGFSRPQSEVKFIFTETSPSRSYQERRSNGSTPIFDKKNFDQGLGRETRTGKRSDTMADGNLERSSDSWQGYNKFSKLQNSYFQRYIALYNYRPVNPDELPLVSGDVIAVVEQCDDGWYVGFREGSSRFGTFPGNYVRPL